VLFAFCFLLFASFCDITSFIAALLSHYLYTITLSHYQFHYHCSFSAASLRQNKTLIWSLPVNHWARLVWTGLDWTCCVCLSFVSVHLTLYPTAFGLIVLETSPTPQPWIVDKFSRMMWNRIYHAYETIMQLC
jgi:hypothetical protein